MSMMSDVLGRLRTLDPEALLNLRPPYPPVALAIDRERGLLVRLKHRRGPGPLLEAHAERSFAEPCVPASIFQPVVRPGQELIARLQELFEASGTRPGRVSLVLPDNLAKISLIALPERPSSPRHLDELVRSKMRRAVPFRLEEARLSYQMFPGTDRDVSVLAVLVRQALIESLELALGALGARLGLIDIATPNLINLQRTALEAAAGGGDVALFNGEGSYFSLVILRQGRLIFFRCKTFGVDDDAPAPGPNGELVRELASSFSYYREKLSGRGIQAIFVRSLGVPYDEIRARLQEMEVGRIEPLDPLAGLEVGGGPALDAATALRYAPAIGAALGRAR
jgi:hypothetical protein